MYRRRRREKDLAFRLLQASKSPHTEKDLVALIQFRFFNLLLSWNIHKKLIPWQNDRQIRGDIYILQTRVNSPWV